MSLPKRGSRKIVVASQTFRWLCSKPQYQGPWREPTAEELDARWLEMARRFGLGQVREVALTVVIEHGEEPVSHLQGHFVGLIVDGFLGPEQGIRLSPKHIRALIEAGLQQGWSPRHCGNLTLHAADVTRDTLQPTLLVLPGWNNEIPGYENTELPAVIWTKPTLAPERS